MLNHEKPSPLTSPLLEGSRLRHGYFTREGGVSEGIYRGLNVGIGSRDIPGRVLENRRRVTAEMGVAAQNLVTPHQVHSPDVVTVSGPFAGERPRADGIVTATPGLAIGVLTADCGPILFADSNAGVIGAAHAGWRGALSGVLENTIDAMIALGAQRSGITAVLGPCIGPKNYEVGPEFIAQFAAANPAYERFFRDSERTGYHMFDLWGFIMDRLENAGIQGEAMRQCTYADEDRFYSYRRTTHRNEPDYGRQISTIAITE
ncbi:MAG: peptidoglycan editing factor PgeF [Phyllobacterium sp.]